MRLSNPLPLFMLMVLFSPLSIDIFLPAIPQMADMFNVPVSWMQQSIPVFLLAVGLGQLIAGPLADKYGRRPIALIGACFYVLTSAAAAMATNFELLMLLRLGQGLAACTLSVAAFAGVRDHFGADQSKGIFSYLNGVICIVPALAPLLGGILTQWKGWPANFWFIAGYGFVVVTAMFILLDETRPKASVRCERLFSADRYMSVLKIPAFRFYSVLNMLGMAMIIGYVTQSPTRLMIDMQMPGNSYALWFGANAAISIIASILVPRLIRKTGSHFGLWLGTGLMAIAAIAVVMCQSLLHPLSFMGPVFVASIGFCFLIAIATGNALAPFGDKAGTASALMGFIQMFGSACLVGLLGVSGLSVIQQLSILMILPLIWLSCFQLRKPVTLQVPATSS